jgi:hypothetical protein
LGLDRFRIAVFFDNLDALHAAALSPRACSVRLECRGCRSDAHLASHGFVYVKQAQAEPVAVGKRVICVNRRGRAGCGASFSLRLASRVPHLQHSAAAVQVFIDDLIAGAAVESAYQQALRLGADQLSSSFESAPVGSLPGGVDVLDRPQQPCTQAANERTGVAHGQPPGRPTPVPSVPAPARSARHAWRWLDKLHRHLGQFRQALVFPALRPNARLCAAFAHRSTRLRVLLPTLVALKACDHHGVVSAFQLAAQAAFLT